jgi:hypothetical protein
MQQQLLAGALALALAACSGNGTETAPPDAFAAAIPDVSGLTLELEDDGDDGVPAGSTDPGGPASVGNLTLTPPNDLQLSRLALRGLNDVVRLLVGRIHETLAAGGPPPTGEQKVYGPVVRCVVGTDPASCTQATFRLAVTRVRDGVFTWRLDAWPVGGDPAGALGVSVGWMARGELEHRGTGRLVLDLGHLALVVPGFGGRGVLLAGFANGPVGKAVDFRLRGFTPDDATHAPASFTIGGYRNFVTGTARIRVATVAEVVPPPPGESDRGPELVHSDFVWNPPLGGRSFSVITNWYDPFIQTLLPADPIGDVPWVTDFDEHYFHVRACYAPVTAALLFRQAFLCDGPGSDAPEPPPACVARVGSVNGTVLFPATPTETDTWERLCALDVATNPGFVEPSGAPSTNPDDGAGPTEGLDGLPPPPEPPADPDDVAPPADG